MALTPKQESFCKEYLIDLNATQAAIRAGYSEKTAHSQGPRLLEHVEIQGFLQDRIKERSERTEITQDYVLKTIKNTVVRCQGKGLLYDPASVLKGCDLLARHLGMFQKDNEQGKDRTVILDFTGSKAK